jgi:hypothetical protein
MNMHRSNPLKLVITYREQTLYTPLASNFEIIASSSPLRWIV